MTKKVGLTLAIATVLSANVYAKDWFIGTEVGKAEINGKFSSTPLSGSFESDNEYVGITIGKYITNNIRVSGSIYEYNEDSGVKIEHQEVGMDYLFGNSQFKPLLGIGVSNLSYKESGLKLSGIGYGLKAGAIYEINDKIDFELGYKYMFFDEKDTIDVGGIPVTYKADDAQAIYFGLSYNF
ncbi:MAG: outer membrane beta-barrel protein [Arcobacteraceae bacterium]